MQTKVYYNNILPKKLFLLKKLKNSNFTINNRLIMMIFLLTIHAVGNVYAVNNYNND